MIRLIVLGFVLVLGLIATVVSLYLIFAIIRWIKRLFSTTTEFANTQHQDWKSRQSEKNIPVHLKEANKRLKRIQKHSEQLSAKWQFLLNPVIEGAQELINTGLEKPDQTQSIRTFYTVTLKTLESFTQTLVDVGSTLQKAEEEKAKQSIELFMTDVYKYRSKVNSKKHFDFHVMMDMIKQRLKK